jgi:hypothetical protein
MCCCCVASAAGTGLEARAPSDLRFKAIANGPGAQHFYRFWRRETCRSLQLLLQHVPEVCAAGLKFLREPAAWLAQVRR